MLKNLLLKFYDWLGRKLNIPIHVCPEPPVHVCPQIPDNIFIIGSQISDILPEIKELIINQDSIPDASGEYKRHQIYSKLIKNHPDISKSDIAMGIELGIKNIRGQIDSRDG